MERRFRKSFWWAASLCFFVTLAVACCSKKHAAQPAQATPEMPKPGMENPEQTDSLKKAIDLQRQKKIKGQ